MHLLVKSSCIFQPFLKVNTCCIFLMNLPLYQGLDSILLFVVSNIFNQVSGPFIVLVAHPCFPSSWGFSHLSSSGVLKHQPSLPGSIHFQQRWQLSLICFQLPFILLPFSFQNFGTFIFSSQLRPCGFNHIHLRKCALQWGSCGTADFARGKSND